MFGSELFNIISKPSNSIEVRCDAKENHTLRYALHGGRIKNATHREAYRNKYTEEVMLTLKKLNEMTGTEVALLIRTDDEDTGSMEQIVYVPSGIADAREHLVHFFDTNRSLVTMSCKRNSNEENVKRSVRCLAAWYAYCTPSRKKHSPTFSPPTYTLASLFLD